MTLSEFKLLKRKFKEIESNIIIGTNDDVDVNNFLNLPESVDWVSKGATYPVINEQTSCGLSPYYAATSAIGGASFIKNGNLPTQLSVEQLLDCSGGLDDNCNGGHMTDMYQYVIKNGGLASATSYPYANGNQKCLCPSQTCESAVKITSYVNVSNSEIALKEAVAKQPVSVAFFAFSENMYLYKSGVFDCTDPSCVGPQSYVDTGAVVTGYGYDATSNKDFWAIQTSFGLNFGDMGFVYIVRNVGPNGSSRQLGVTTQASYPVL